MAMSINKIIGIVIALLMIGILLPIGVDELTAYTSTNANIQTLVSEVIPIVAVVGLVSGLIYKGRSG